MIYLKKDSSFYRHCKIKRRSGEKMCDDCPFREYIEAQELIWQKLEEKTEKEENT
jgi:hypothetical protein